MTKFKIGTTMFHIHSDIGCDDYYVPEDLDLSSSTMLSDDLISVVDSVVGSTDKTTVICFKDMCHHRW